MSNRNSSRYAKESWRTGVLPQRTKFCYYPKKAWPAQNKAITNMVQVGNGVPRRHTEPGGPNSASLRRSGRLTEGKVRHSSKVQYKMKIAKPEDQIFVGSPSELESRGYFRISRKKKEQGRHQISMRHPFVKLQSRDISGQLTRRRKKTEFILEQVALWHNRMTTGRKQASLARKISTR